MTKVEKGKSRRWYENNCGICKKKFSVKEDRAKGHCVFKDGEELDFFACLPCAKSADISTAVEQTKELGKYDTNQTDIQPEDPKMSSGQPPDGTGTGSEKIT
jgi:hypothetical protein